MFKSEIAAVSESAKAKEKLFNSSKSRYFICAMLAGLYVGFGVFAMAVTGGVLGAVDYPTAKLLNAAVFPVALSLVVFAGSELFTGNTFVMTVGAAKKTVSAKAALSVCLLAYIGNFAGSVVGALLFNSTGLLSGTTLDFVLSTAETKMSLSVCQLVSRGIFCNMLVCLAVWCCAKMKSEPAKLVMIFWCIFAFVICGFEHSIANMTTLTLALLAPHPDRISVAGLFYNLLWVTLGNIIGGVVAVALPYLRISGAKE